MTSPPAENTTAGSREIAAGLPEAVTPLLRSEVSGAWRMPASALTQTESPFAQARAKSVEAFGCLSLADYHSVLLFERSMGRSAGAFRPLAWRAGRRQLRLLSSERDDLYARLASKRLI